MRYELMLPHQIRDAIDRRLPCVLPIGVLEYHAEHLAVGMDTLAVDRSLARLEAEMDLVVLPPFYYGAASYAVAPAVRNGTIQVGGEALAPFAKALFGSLLNIGFRNVHGIVHHQSENFWQGMPTDLAFRTAARGAIFDFLDRTRGEGWWGREEMSDYYARHAANSDPFNWIRIHPLMDAELIAAYDFDHAGVGETSLMMALCPEGVDMARFDATPWYSRSAAQATQAYGDQAVTMILERLRRMFQ